MIRTLLEFLVSRSVDDGKPLPDWVRRRVERDSSLHQFQRQTQHAHVALRDAADRQHELWAVDSPEHIATVERPSIEVQQRRATVAGHPRRRHLARAAMAIAAGLLVFAVVDRNLENKANAARVEMLSQHLAELPPTMLDWLNLSVESSQAGIMRYAPTAQLSFPSPPPWESWNWRDHVRLDPSEGSPPPTSSDAASSADHR